MTTTDFNDIESAALYVNNALVSRGFLKDTERLSFASIESQDDDAGEPKDDALNEMRIINTIYSLLTAIDMGTSVSEHSIINSSAIKQELAKEQQLNAKLRSRNAELEQKMRSLAQANAGLEASLKTSETDGARYRISVAKFSTALKQGRQQFAIELRKRDLQISRLKERLQDTRRTKTLVGLNGTLSKSFNSYSTTLKREDVHQNDLPDEILGTNATLLTENADLLNLLSGLHDRIQNIMIDTGVREAKEDIAGVSHRSAFSADLSREISDTISALSDVLRSPNFVTITELNNRDEEIRELKLQLEEMRAQWSRALTTMEEWNRYEVKRVTSQ